MKIGEFLQNPVFEGYMVNEYFNQNSMYERKLRPRPISDYFHDVNLLEDYDKVIIEAKSKRIILLIHDEMRMSE